MKDGDYYKKGFKAMERFCISCGINPPDGKAGYGHGMLVERMAFKGHFCQGCKSIVPPSSRDKCVVCFPPKRGLGGDSTRANSPAEVDVELLELRVQIYANIAMGRPGARALDDSEYKIA